MSRFTEANERLAREIVARYPRPKSATIPLCHLAQEQDGYLADDAMVHIAELVGVTSAEVLGTASFYEMFKREPVGTYVVNICTNISCQLMGGEELLEHAERTLGVGSGGTTSDGMFTVEDVEARRHDLRDLDVAHEAAASCSWRAIQTGWTCSSGGVMLAMRSPTRSWRTLPSVPCGGMSSRAPERRSAMSRSKSSWVTPCT